MRATASSNPLFLIAGVAAACLGGAAAAQVPGLDKASLTQLVDAVSLDVMSEASLQACDDVGAPAFEQMRAAWTAWREKHQLAPLRLVVMDLKRRQRNDASWDDITEPMRQRVLADPAPDQACAALARDWQTAGMDITALYPQARAAAVAAVKAELASPPKAAPVFMGAAKGQFLLPTQIDALAAQHQGGWSSISEKEAQAKLGWVYVKGRVKRWSRDPDRFSLVTDQGERISGAKAYLSFDAEAWVGREVVVRGLVTNLRSYAIDLDDGALVTDTSGLTPSPLPQEPLARKEVLLQRVMTPPGRGLSEKDLAAVVIHGQSDFSNGTRWVEDVRFLLRDGTAYKRTDMPPDQLDVSASRKLEPQEWGRWRAGGKAYEMQAQDFDGKPAGDWKPLPHRVVKPWPKDTRLDGYFSRGTFSGSLVTGGISSKRAIRFTRDGRFERSYSSLGTSGGLAAINGANISASSHGDGKGSSSTAGGTVAGPLGTVGASSGTTTKDDGASRRGRYQLSGFVLTLDYDDGHQERLLSFPVYEDGKTIYVGSGSLSLAK